MKKWMKLVMSVLFACLSVLPATTVHAAPKQKLTVYMPSPAGLADNLAALFKEETGIDVDVFQGTTGEILARLEAEKANPIADVVILASWTDGLQMKAADRLMSYEPTLADKIVPEFIDTDHQLFGSSASAVGVIYNTDIFDTLDADWADLGKDAKYEDHIAMPDPEKSGAAKDFVTAYVEANGWTDFEAMGQNGLTIPGANRAALEAVTTGEVAILVGGVDYNGFKSMDDGEPLAMYYPKGGTVVNPRPAMILKDAPNPEVAKQFIDFLFSDKAQQLVIDSYLIPGRVDMKSDKRPNLDEIPQIKPDWQKMMADSAEVAKQINELGK